MSCDNTTTDGCGNVTPPENPGKKISELNTLDPILSPSDLFVVVDSDENKTKNATYETVMTFQNSATNLSATTLPEAIVELDDDLEIHVTNYDIHYPISAIPGLVVSGGEAGDVLKKTTSADYDYEWGDPSGLVFGTSGQVMTTNDSEDDYEWVDPDTIGVTVHAGLMGLDADDHTQYLTSARGDARYYTQTQLDSTLTNYYTSAETDALLADKVDNAELDNYYTSATVDTLLADKVDNTELDNYYTSAETDTLLADKVNTTELDNYYTSAETDALLADKVDNSELDNYYTSATVDTLLDGKEDTLSYGTSGQVMATNGAEDTYVWIDIPTAPVQSVNTKTGIVVLDKTDIGLSAVDNTSDLDKPVSDDTQDALDLKIDSSEKAQQLGVATLDGSGTLEVDQIPAYLLGAVHFIGTWDASTGDEPSITPSKGQYWIVSTSGTTGLDGITDWQVSDFAIYGTSAWQKIDNTDQVVSVNGRQGTVNLGLQEITDYNNITTKNATFNGVEIGFISDINIYGVNTNSDNAVFTNNMNTGNALLINNTKCGFTSRVDGSDPIDPQDFVTLTYADNHYATSGVDLETVTSNGITTTNGITLNAEPLTVNSDLITSSNMKFTAYAPVSGHNLLSIGTDGTVFTRTDNTTTWDSLVSNATHSGDVTGSGALTISADAVTYAKMQNIVADNVLLGNNSGADSVVDELTGTEVTVLLDTFTSTLKGLAPASGGGSVNFLRADGTWATPAGGGDMSNPMTTAGDVIYGGASGTPTRLGIGTANQILVTNAGATAPEWVDQQASFDSGLSGDRPSSPETGYPYFNTSLGYQTWYNGTYWVNSTGAYLLPNL